MRLLLNSNALSLWQEIIHEAEATCEITLKEELESYLVFLMMRYTAKPEMVKHTMATDFLQGMQLGFNQRQLILQEVGDKCLIFTGLFPQMAEKRLVKISYFVNLGQSSYANISKAHDDLYASLAKQFVPLMDILSSIRHTPHPLLPLEAYELWSETGSQRAYSLLMQYQHQKRLPH